MLVGQAIAEFSRVRARRILEGPIDPGDQIRHHLVISQDRKRRLERAGHAPLNFVGDAIFDPQNALEYSLRKCPTVGNEFLSEYREGARESVACRSAEWLDEVVAPNILYAEVAGHQLG